MTCLLLSMSFLPCSNLPRTGRGASLQPEAPTSRQRLTAASIPPLSACKAAPHLPFKKNILSLLFNFYDDFVETSRYQAFQRPSLYSHVFSPVVSWALSPQGKFHWMVSPRFAAPPCHHEAGLTPFRDTGLTQANKKKNTASKEAAGCRIDAAQEANREFLVWSRVPDAQKAQVDFRRARCGMTKGPDAVWAVITPPHRFYRRY
jgi:hypothetical protein